MNLSDLVTDQLRPIRQQYWSFVRDCAQETADEHANHTLPQHIENCDDCGQMLDDTADGTEWTIYTRNAYLVLLVSDNADAGEENLGADLMTTDLDETVNRAAFYALRADLANQLTSLLEAQIDVPA